MPIGKGIRGIWAMVSVGDEGFQYTLADIVPGGTTGDPETDAQIRGLLDLINGFSDRLPEDNDLQEAIRVSGKVCLKVEGRIRTVEK